MNASSGVTRGAKERPEVIRTADVVRVLLRQKQKTLGVIPEKKAAALINAAWGELGKRIGKMKEGVVRVPGLGNFQIRQIHRNKDGQKGIVIRTVFRASRRWTKARRTESPKT